MAFVTPYTFVALQTLTAAQLNAIQTNITALWPYTAAGDIPYASASNALARLAKGTAGQVLKMNSGATAPEWGSGNITTGNSSVITFSSQTNTSFADVTNSSFNMTLTETSTILLFACMVAKSISGSFVIVRGYIDGTTSQESVVLPGYSGDYDVPMFIMQRKTGVSSGTKTLKLQARTAGTASYSLYNGIVYGLVIPE